MKQERKMLPDACIYYTNMKNFQVYESKTPYLSFGINSKRVTLVN